MHRAQINTKGATALGQGYAAALTARGRLFGIVLLGTLKILLFVFAVAVIVIVIVLLVIININPLWSRLRHGGPRPSILIN